MMQRFRHAVLLFVLVCVAHVDAAEIEWTGWLGPHRNGWVHGFRIPAKWPAKLTKGWQVKVGTGYGSPLVSGGRVYQHARQGNEEVLWCFDLETGRKIWRKSYSAPFKIGGGGQYHGKGPKSSPTLAGGRIFTMAITGVLSAWDAQSGELLWKQDYRKNYQHPTPRWGNTVSPIVDNDIVVAHFGTDGRGTLMAHDTTTGKRVWKQGRHGPSYSSPLLVNIQGVRQIIDWNEKELVGVESNTGKKLWSYPHPQTFTDQNMPTPVFHDGCILVGAENRGVRSIQPKKMEKGWTVREKWRQRQVALDMSTAVMNGDHLYGMSHYGAGRIFCLDSATGKVLWQGPGRTGKNVTFLSLAGYVLALRDNGRLEVLQTNAKAYHKVASYRVAKGDTWAPPVLLNKGVLTKDRDTLTLWKFPR